jgi:protein required for attachment to host cells
MPNVGLRNGVWVLVCDGRKALLLQNAGDRVYPKLETRKVAEHADPLTHDLGTDVPGRTTSGTSARHSAMEPKDYQRQSEAAFIKHIAADLEHRVMSGDIKDLILVAPARALGMLRHDISAHVAAVVRTEIDRDYVREPVYEIEKHLVAFLAEHAA